MGTALNPAGALVSFSGGQDSTTALAWALNRYGNVETVGFRYGQKHFIELEQRPVIRKAIVEVVPEWRGRLGPDHVVELDLIGQLAAQNIVSPPGHSLISGDGFAAGRRYIPGRNLIMLSMCASVAFRRDIRTLVCGASETEYSGYPDCRSETMKAVERAISLSSGFDFKIQCPLMSLDKAGVWMLAHSLGGDRLVTIVREDTHTCYSGSREHLHEWGYGCSVCEACRLREKGWRDFCKLHANAQRPSYPLP
jgi:7-cyano-7-deazaguanine synthase